MTLDNRVRAQILAAVDRDEALALLRQAVAVASVTGAEGPFAEFVAERLADAGATQVEPGHGLTGTTPLHAMEDLPEIPAVAYLTEVSHLYGERAYAFGGGLYIDPVFPPYQVRAIVSDTPTTDRSALANVEIPPPDAIDYYAMVDATGPRPIRSGDSVVFGFRGQAFVTRAHVAGLRGVSTGEPQVAGIWVRRRVTQRLGSLPRERGEQMTSIATQTAVAALRLDRIRKEFGGVVAVQEFSLDVQPREIVALVGDNGAGKSTIVKIVSGVYRPTAGSIELNGQPVLFSDASAARSHGVEVVYQDLALAEMQPVYMNMFLGRERVTGPLRWLDKKRMAAETQALVDELDVRIPSAHATIRDLSGGQRQGVAIARATHWATSLVLMDEPTAALGVAETGKVERLMRQLRDGGRAILLVSHNLDQVFRVADRIAVLRRGTQIGVRETARTSHNEIVSMITGLQPADVA